MIYVIAPYSPAGGRLTNLGAARKLESVVEVLAGLDPELLLINTAHDAEEQAGLRIDPGRIGAVPATVVTLPTKPRRAVGKLANLLFARRDLSRLAGLPPPKLVWIYNGYALEARMARLLRKSFGCPVILEFEDWHFSRQRARSFKPYVDYCFWRRLVPQLAGAFCVNQSLVATMERHQVPAHELPGFVPPQIAALCDASPPFRSHSTRVGYFGGLNAEKGADQLLRIIPDAPAHCHFVVCGAGPLLEEFRSLAGRLPGRLTVRSGLPFTDLVALVGGCDVVLNPHTVTAHHLFGLFPSKVLEAIGSGRLVISTRLPPLRTRQVLGAVVLYDGTDADLLEKLRRAHTLYAISATDVLACARLAATEFGPSALADKIAALLDTA